MNAITSGLALALAFAAAGSAEPRPLPAFTVAGLDGAAASSATLVREGQWLLVYVRPHSGPARTVLTALQKGRPGPAASKVVVVVGGTAGGARALAAEFVGLKDAAWYVDTSEEAFRALGLAGVPVVLGLRDGGIEWSLAGVTPDGKRLAALLSSW
jgi:hypothetical protein